MKFFAVAAVLFLANSALAGIECKGTAPGKKEYDSPIETTVRLVESAKQFHYDITITQTEKGVSTGYMLGHGGLGIHTRDNYQDLWLYSGYGKGRNGDTKPGSLTHKEFALEKLPVQCDYDDTLKFPDALPELISCESALEDGAKVTAKVSLPKNEGRSLAVSFEIKDARVLAADYFGTTTFYIYESKIHPKSKGIFSIALRLGKGEKGLGTVNLPGADSSARVECEYTETPTAR